MAILDINWKPNTKELRFFGALLIFFSVLAALWIRYHHEWPTVANLVLGVGLATGLVGCLLPRCIWPLYVVWMAIAFPIGWLVSHTVMAATFYLVVTPIGLIMRMLGRDPMTRRFDPGASTYWQPRQQQEDTARYFRQF